MDGKRFNARVTHKHDIEANWLKAENFIPLEGELIIYDADEFVSSPRFKVGDGETVVSSLPFTSSEAVVTGSFAYFDEEEPVEGVIATIEAQNPMIQEGVYYHPQTTAKQVILPDGRRLGSTDGINLTADDVGALTIDETILDGEATSSPVNADTFAGMTYDQFKGDLGELLPDYALRLDPNDTPIDAQAQPVDADTLAGYTYDQIVGDIKNDITSGGMVTSVNGQTGDVVVEIPEMPEIPVTSVNGQTGDVTVTRLNEDEAVTYGINGMQYFNASMAASDSATSNGSPNGTDWYHIIRLNHANAGGYFIDIAVCFHSNNFYYRRIENGVTRGWVRLMDASRFSLSGTTLYINT